ncbi:hypothetical protein VNO77_22746 [Canavalia gladiata]|uniref:Uncharacterized protein n=1 Tax=Canavalia gladiata TaxID=3824 RepID=A0AAN9L3C2_CANGL
MVEPSKVTNVKLRLSPVMPLSNVLDSGSSLQDITTECGDLRTEENDEDGLRTQNISQCTALTLSAIRTVCDSYPTLHTCSGRHSLIMSGYPSFPSMHCAYAVPARHAILILLFMTAIAKRFFSTYHTPHNPYAEHDPTPPCIRFT